jgi:hypothetical protein
MAWFTRLEVKSQLKNHVAYGENTLSLSGIAPSNIIGDLP